MTRRIPAFDLLTAIFGMQFNADPAQFLVNTRFLALARSE
jgi:hypothetical protein